MSETIGKRYVSDNPSILAEWDWEQNPSTLDPYTLTQGSTKRANWICAKGHRWSCRIDHRFVMKSGCPYCAGKRPIVGENDLATTHPHLIADWIFEKSIIRPEETKAGTNRKVWWHCKECGRDYEQSISHRALRNSGCPDCSARKRASTRVQNLVMEIGSLAEIDPTLCQEWMHERNMPLEPSQVTAGSNKRAWWKCGVCGYEWRKSIAVRHNGSGCPVCDGKAVMQGYNDLATTHPHLIAEWHPVKNGELTPESITAGSSKYIWWLCKVCGNDWKSPAYSRKNGYDCPICAGRKVVVGYNDLVTTHPTVASEWHPTKNYPLSPLEVVAGCNKGVWWKCQQCGNEWKTTVSSRSSGCGCSVCAQTRRMAERQKTILKSVGSLLETHPHLITEWDYEKNINVKPEEVTYGSGKKVVWKCSRGHSWKATISSRVAGRSCPYCSSEVHTSFPEQVLFFYLSQVALAENRKMIHGKELDIFLPNFAVGVEYNGRFYHKGKHEKDREKIEFFREKGIRVLSINEGNVDLIEGDQITYFYKPKNYPALEWCIRGICDLIHLSYPNVNIEKDLEAIYGRYIIGTKVNSLGVQYPKIAEQWHPTLNGVLTPEMISHGSQKKVWWQCQNNSKHFWIASVSSRKRAGCPICAGRYHIAVKGINDLFSMDPLLKQEWLFEKNEELDPYSLTPFSRKEASWRCQKCGYEWCDTIAHRAEGAGCPLCSSSPRS